MKWTAESRRELHGLVNPCSGRKHERECQVRVAGHRAGDQARRRGFSQYLKQGAGERSLSDPSQRELQDSGERERRVEGTDASEAENACEVRIRVVGDARASRPARSRSLAWTRASSIA